MAVSEKKREQIDRYDAENMRHISLKYKKEYVCSINDHCKTQNMARSAWIREAMDFYMDWQNKEAKN